MAHRIKEHKYTVNLIFNSDGSKVLLQLKDRSKFKGCFNGIGGKIEDGEYAKVSAIREIKEESNIILDTSDLEWLGTLQIPYDCSDNAERHQMCTLYFYGAKIDNEEVHKPDDATEILQWFKIKELLGPKTMISPRLAGNGDLEYFINLGHIMLFGSEDDFYKWQKGINYVWKICG